MKILVVGSSTPDGSESYPERFGKACQEIGEALARAGHTVVVGTSWQGSADCHAVKGALGVETGRNHSVLVITPYKSDFYDEHPKIRQRLSRESWAVGRVDQILAADGVITVGGRQSTLEAGSLAMTLQRPLLPVPHFGGTSATLFERVEAVYLQSKSISPKLQPLRAPWDSRSAALVSELITELIKSNPFNRKGVPTYLLLVLLLILLSLWVWLFLSPLPERHTLSFFLLLGLSSLIGTTLRNSQLVMNGQVHSISWGRLFAEVTVSLCLAFGLLLFHMVGEITITGRQDFARLAQENEFRRVAIIMSIMGLAAGLLIEKVAERLTKLIETAISR